MARDRNQGFATMDPAKHREISRKGGQRAHALGKGHQWDSDAARAAGRKGGLATAAKRAAGEAGEKLARLLVPDSP